MPAEPTTAPNPTLEGHPLAGWDLTDPDAVEWVPWGEGDLARAKVLAAGDGYLVALVEARPGSTGGPHRHDHTEFAYVLDGEVRTQGRPLGAGQAYVAAAGSEHRDFHVADGATYLSIFKL